MKIQTKILWGVMVLFIASWALGESPDSIGWKLKFGMETKNDDLLLQATDQLLDERGGERFAEREAMNTQIRVGGESNCFAEKFLEGLIAATPNDHILDVQLAGFLAMTGDYSGAINNLTTAKQILDKGKELDPDDMDTRQD